jgi:uncharacterized protein
MAFIQGGPDMSKSRGNFGWYELMTSDTKAAEAFYKAVVGWTAQDSGLPGMSYTILSAGSASVGGIAALTPEARKAGAQAGWLGYIMVDDVDAFVARVQKAGGSVHRAPADIAGVGRFSIVADPQGAVFVLMKPFPTAQREQPKAGSPGHTGWHELYAGDGRSAFTFYSELFGWTKDQAMDMGAMGVYQLFSADDAMIGGMMTKPPAIPMPVWLYYFNVERIDDAAQRVKANGGQVRHGPQQVPGGSWIIQCADPQGAMFALLGAQR